MKTAGRDPAAASSLRRALPDNGMHPTRDTPPVINPNRAGGRVMPGVRRPPSVAVLTTFSR
jgi:hypothetical protein